MNDRKPEIYEDPEWDKERRRFKKDRRKAECDHVLKLIAGIFIPWTMFCYFLFKPWGS